jgi:hypothetical protein
MDTRGLGDRFLARARDFSLFHSVQTASWARQASYTLDKEGGDVSPGVKRYGRETDHLSQSSAQVQNGGAIPPLPHLSSGRSV